MSATLCLRNATRSLITRRFYSASAEGVSVRQQIMDGVKTAMKAKDTFKSTLLRSVLAEIYSADKVSGDLPTPAIISVMRKSIARRNDAIAQFKQGNREDLAEKEAREIEIINSFLPPLLSEDEIDVRIRAAIERSDVQDLQKGKGKVLKAFYTSTDRSEVDTVVVNQRLDAVIKSIVA
ncbi:Yqey-like protein-domain-containing protein [Mucidula mucida]|nr:Yqey-like protein-domain-containing protein [Mucidula mucida]